jgi:hypothetical protein
MQSATRAALLAAYVGVAAGSVVGACIYAFLLRPDLPASSLVLPSALLGLVTGATSFVVVFGLVYWLHRKARAAIGQVAGAGAGVCVLALVTLAHAAVAPGADGWLLSFLGQFSLAVVLVGWLAVSLGVALSRYINRLDGKSGT